VFFQFTVFCVRVRLWFRVAIGSISSPLCKICAI